MDPIKYIPPAKWGNHDPLAIMNSLIDAKAAVMSLSATPKQKRWMEEMQEMQLKIEVNGTSRIEGADFAGNELEQAMQESPEQLLTRSQRQAHAAVSTYRWLATIPTDKPIDTALILEIHRRIVTGADDDHCAPGKLRTQDQNVTFGMPSHRGVSGGNDCIDAMDELVKAINGPLKAFDPLVRALMVHYYMAAMHPFLDGNGRTARALEALMLLRSGMESDLFIAMSNYYYDEKNRYLLSLASTRAKLGDLTEFLIFGLQGIALQTQRLALLLKVSIAKELYRGLLHELYPRLMNGRRRVLGERQIILAEYLLKKGKTEVGLLVSELELAYTGVNNPRKALIRDVTHLRDVGALKLSFRTSPNKERVVDVEPVLDWPSKITHSKFFDMVQQLPKTKADAFMISP